MWKGKENPKIRDDDRVQEIKPDIVNSDAIMPVSEDELKESSNEESIKVFQELVFYTRHIQ